MVSRLGWEARGSASFLKRDQTQSSDFMSIVCRVELPAKDMNILRRSNHLQINPFTLLGVGKLIGATDTEPSQVEILNIRKLLKLDID